MPLITTDTPLLSPARGTPEQALAYFRARGAARLEEVERLVRAYYRLGQALGLNADAIVASADLETGTFQNRWWRERLNAGSLGVTGDPQQNERSPTFRDGEHAATAHVSHWLVYALGPSAARTRWMRAGLPGDVAEIDPRYAAYLEAYGDRAVAPTLAGLAGTYAADRAYAQKIVQRATVIFGEREDSQMSEVAFGRVPHPAFQPRDIPSSITTAWNDLGPRTIRAVCWHRMLGSLWGTDGYFRDTRPTGGANKALTDYGVGVAAQDGAAADGLILRWNDPRGRRSPWANGKVDDPYGDGLAFVNRYGVDAVNRDVVSIEISGFQQTPLSEASRNAIAALTAYWADQYKVSHETFPLIPGEGNRSFVIWHDEFTRGTGKRCPFEVIKAETNDLIERTRDVLRRYQVGERPAEPPSPRPEPSIYPEGLDEELAERWFGTVQARDTSGRLRTYSFNPVGSVSRLWLERGAATGQWPALVAVEQYDTRIYFRFADGWTVWRPNENASPKVLRR